MTASVNQFLRVARSQLGYHEGKDHTGWNNDTKFGKWYGLNFNPWCGMFLSWCANQIGSADIMPRFAYTPDGERWFKDRGQWGTKPKVGAFGFLHTPGFRNGLAHHVFVVEAVHGNTFTTVEGNTNTTGSDQGDGVYRLTRANSSRFTFGYPKYKTAPTVDLSKVTRAAEKNHLSAPAGTRRVQSALASEGLLKGYIPGHFGKSTKEAYRKWQKSKPGGGFKGQDANGIPGEESLKRLGRKHNFHVKK